MIDQFVLAEAVWTTIPALVVWLAAWSVMVYAFGRLAPALCRADIGRGIGRPEVVIVAAAALGTVMACAPVIFLGQSLLAPNNGPTTFFYEDCPVVEGQTDCRPEMRPGADTGAMDWYFYPITRLGEVAIKERGEFPLWNRYNSTGVSIIGQGQAMLGDPFTWAQWIVGADAWSFDIKFILLRLVFASAIGLSVLVITRSTAPSLVAAFAASFIGFFGSRVNHTEIFTICYAPLIMLSWLHLTLNTSPRHRFWWIAGLVVANWLVLNSGTAKQAYMASAVLNLAGFLLFVVSGMQRKQAAFLPFLAMLIFSGICFSAAMLPFFGLFLESLGKGATAYDIPAVEQFPLSQAIFFADPILGLLLTGRFAVASNALLLLGGLAALLSLWGPELAQRRDAVLSLCIAAGLCFVLAFAVVPETWVLTMPFLRNVVHLNQTFGAILLVPASVLGGVGFHVLFLRAAEATAAGLLGRVMAVFLVLIGAYALGLPAIGAVTLSVSIALAVALLWSASVATWFLCRMLVGRLNLRDYAVCTIALLLVLGKNASFPPFGTEGSDILFEPGERVSLSVPPGIVARLREKLHDAPSRVIGIEKIFVPGYNAALGLETISGPDAVKIRSYSELTQALGLPLVWDWRMMFSVSDLARNEAALNLLGVQYVFSAKPIPSLRSVDSDGRVTLYERRGAWPRAFFTDRVESYEGLRELSGRIDTGSVAPFVAVWQGDDEAMQQTAGFRAESAMASSVVAATDYDLAVNETRFTIQAPKAGVIYLGEANVPGDFVATLNGQNASIISANHAFKAIAVGAPGVYRVAVTYMPAHLKLYLTIAVAGTLTWLLSMCVFWLYILSWHNRVAQPRSDEVPEGS